jgi:hypothetical protein
MNSHKHEENLIVYLQEMDFLTFCEYLQQKEENGTENFKIGEYFDEEFEAFINKSVNTAEEKTKILEIYSLLEMIYD